MVSSFLAVLSICCSEPQVCLRLKQSVTHPKSVKARNQGGAGDLRTLNARGSARSTGRNATVSCLGDIDCQAADIWAGESRIQSGVFSFSPFRLVVSPIRFHLPQHPCGRLMNAIFKERVSLLEPRRTGHSMFWVSCTGDTSRQCGRAPSPSRRPQWPVDWPLLFSLSRPPPIGELR